MAQLTDEDLALYRDLIHITETDGGAVITPADDSPQALAAMKELTLLVASKLAAETVYDDDDDDFGEPDA